MHEQKVQVIDQHRLTSLDEYRPADDKPTLEIIIKGWLDEKTSERTQHDYAYTLALFVCQWLAERNLHLDSQEPQQVINIRLAAQEFSKHSTKGRKVTDNTINHRLAVLESFYTYALTNGHITVNPITAVKRKKIDTYKGARKKSLDAATTSAGLDAIERNTPRGKRDYALLTTLLTTGRRANEIATLQLQHLTLSNGIITLSFEHMKNDKEGVNILHRVISDAIMNWLHSFEKYGPDVQVGKPGDTRPIWVSLAEGGRNGKSYGLPLGKQAIADVCMKYMGTSKIHAMRHTFAKRMIEAGVSIRELQALLGHSSVATTEIYAGQLDVPENAYADTLIKSLGIR